MQPKLLLLFLAPEADLGLVAVRTCAGLLAELEPRREVLVVAAAVEGGVVGLASCWVQRGASQ